MTAAEPRISVVVSSHDYGHYLGNCLESLLAQSSPAAEIVVVDDGSTDGTARLLGAYRRRVTALHTSNRGQAAAFNTGFAASSGELVLFVDADDALHPEALEVLRHHWSDDLAVLGFGLEIIDAAGRSTGVHTASVGADRGDNRPRLLGTGTFSFPPTTGNLYARRCLAAVLPMAEPRWRISADCYLIRAAALFGRFGHVPRVLGAYRLHGGNNYAAHNDEHDLSRHRANQRDNADALVMLAKRAGTFAADPAEAAALRFALLDRAQALCAEVDGGPGAARRQAAARRAALRRDHGLAAAVAQLGIPRWPVHLPPGRRIDPAATRWRDLLVPGAGLWPTAPRAAAVLVFALDPAPATRIITLELAVPDLGWADARRLSVTVDGSMVWRGLARPWQAVRLPEPVAPWQARRTVTVAVHCEDAGRAPPIGVRVAGLTLSGGADAYGWPLSRDDGLAPAAALASGLDPADWDLDTYGGATLRGRSGRLRLAVPAAAAHDLLLDFGAAPPRVWLTLRQAEATIFAGRLGDARRIAVRLPPAHPPGRVSLTLQVEGGAPDGGASLRLAYVGLQSWRGLRLDGAADPGGVPAPPLNLGETVHLSRFRQPGLLRDGWGPAGEEAPRNAAAEVTLALCPPAAGRAMTLVLTVAPLLPPGPRLRHLLGVSLGDEIRTAVELTGPGPVEVQLPDDAAGREIRLGLHSTYLSDNPGRGAGPGLVAPFELRSLVLRGVEHATARPALTPVAADRGVPRVEALLAEVGRLLGPDPAIPPDDLPAAAARLRAALTDVLTTCAANALLLFARAPDGIARLVALGAAARPRPPTAAEATALRRAAAQAGAGDPRTATRSTLLALLHRPAHSALVPPDLDALPAPLLWAPVALAEYFTAAPDLENAAAHDAWRTFLAGLLESIHRVLAREDIDSARFRLAAATLTRLRTTPAIFGAGPVRDLIRLRGRCIERLLVRQGARLALPRRPRGTAHRLRLGVLVRDVLPTPEGWALLGMYAGLDPHRFEAVLIRMERSPDALDPGARFAEELCLADFPLEEAVAAVRALDLDLFVTGAYVCDWEKTTAIVAHRLAPLQVWPTAVCPTTSGLGSFDVALSCRASEPEAPERHYVEPLAWIDGPLQAAFAFPSGDRPPAAQVREELGVPPGRLLLVSGAMAHKIGDDLLAAWAAILRGVPKSVLVLYPFAPNWSISFAHDRFRARLDRALGAAGAAPERAILLWTQPPERVRAIVAAADLYLDSFPYAGATTVCEALGAGTPVVTCAGDALRQLTGAAWVRAFGLPDLVAPSPEAYVGLACRLGTEAGDLAAVRARLSDRLAGGPPPHHDRETFGRAFSESLWRLARESGLFPALPATAPAAGPPPLMPLERSEDMRGGIGGSVASEKKGITKTMRSRLGATVKCYSTYYIVKRYINAAFRSKTPVYSRAIPQPFLERSVVFIHIPKAAGNAVTRAIFGKDSIELGGHTPARHYQDLDPEWFNSCFSFSFSRNPISRFISACHFLREGGMNEIDRLWAEAFLRRFDTIDALVAKMRRSSVFRSEILRYTHFIPQTYFICDRNGALIVDFVGKFETFQADMALVSRRTGLVGDIMPVNVTKSTKGTGITLLPESEELLQEVYAEDFSKLGYASGSPRSAPTGE